MKVSETVTLSVEDNVAFITIDNPPVNALSWHVRDGIYEGVTKANTLEDAKAIVLICQGGTYIAGADIRELGGPSKGVDFNLALEAIENSSKPVISAIHGTALGGGLETALTCHYRVAVASAKFGLPEVKLGLLPGAGGTQRLPRIVGVEKALEMMVLGDPIDAQSALACGLIDEIVDDLGIGARAFAQKVIAENKPLTRVRDLEEKLQPARDNPAIFETYRKIVAKRARGFDAPEAIIQCIEDAVNKPFDEGLAEERRRFVALIAGTQSTAQRHYFFAERRANKIPDVTPDTPSIQIQSVGVIGAGTMGGGISMNFLSAGIPVTMVETNQEALDRGVATMRKNFERSAKRLGISQDEVDQRMALLTPSLSMDSLADCDLVIEAVFENLDLKKDIFSTLDAIVKDGAILASNTSALDLNAIAQATKRPDHVVGLHFFSPANIMKLVEIVRGQATSASVMKTAMDLCKRIKKIAVVSGVCHGFIGNRMLAQRQFQSQKMILEGCMPWDVDRVLYEFGMPMGPFAMSDLAGLDLGWDATKSNGETLRDRLCEMGRRGQKTGAGYYDYDPETRAASPNADVENLILEFSEKLQKRRRDYSSEEILQRCIYPMINEGAKILEEGISARPSDIDVVWVNGYGWPVYRGGPMQYADTIGLKKIVETLKGFQEQDGDDFWQPAALLEKLVAEGKTFADLNGA